MKKDIKRKAAALALAAALMLSANVKAVENASAPFTDVATSRWSFSYIMRAYNDGIVNGVGDGKFDPTGTLTYAQFYTILTRAYYADELAKTADGANWYEKYVTVAKKHSLNDVTAVSNVNLAVNRYEMSQIIKNLMSDQGYATPSATVLDSAVSSLPDWSQVPGGYQDSVKQVYHSGIINGYSDGSFNGTANMTREQCATVYCRIVDTLKAGSTVQPVNPTPTPTEPAPQPTPTPDPTPAVTVDPVGTFSDGEANISLATHKPVVDYWSEQMAEVRNLTDKDAFNAAVQTLKDAVKIREHGTVETTGRYKGIDKSYNYAMFEDNGSDGVKNVFKAMVSLQNFGMGFSGIDYKDGTIFISHPMGNRNEYMEIFEPIFARFPAGASDMDKVKICQAEIVERFDYSTASTFDWLLGGDKGPCDSYAIATKTILAYAEIPTCIVGAANHGWNLSRIDGDWYIVDSVTAENGKGVFANYDEHARIFNYNANVNVTGGVIPVIRALVETAWG